MDRDGVAAPGRHLYIRGRRRRAGHPAGRRTGDRGSRAARRRRASAPAALRAPRRPDPVQLPVGPRSRAIGASARLGAAAAPGPRPAAIDGARRARPGAGVERVGLGRAARPRRGVAGPIRSETRAAVAGARLRLAVAAMDSRRLTGVESCRHLVGTARQLGGDRAQAAIHPRRAGPSLLARLVRRVSAGALLPAGSRVESAAHPLSARPPHLRRHRRLHHPGDRLASRQHRDGRRHGGSRVRVRHACVRPAGGTDRGSDCRRHDTVSLLREDGERRRPLPVLVVPLDGVLPAVAGNRADARLLSLRDHRNLVDLHQGPGLRPLLADAFRHRRADLAGQARGGDTARVAADAHRPAARRGGNHLRRVVRALSEPAVQPGRLHGAPALHHRSWQRRLPGLPANRVGTPGTAA